MSILNKIIIFLIIIIFAAIFYLFNKIEHYHKYDGREVPPITKEQVEIIVNEISELQLTSEELRDMIRDVSDDLYDLSDRVDNLDGRTGQLEDDTNLLQLDILDLY